MKNNIRKHINLLESKLKEDKFSDDMLDAIADLENEGGGNPSDELIKDIANDYNLDPEKLKEFYFKKNKKAKKKTNIKNNKKEIKKEIEPIVNPLHIQEVENILSAIKTPPGFLREEGYGTMNVMEEIFDKNNNFMTPKFTEDQAWVKLFSDNIVIIINIIFKDENDKSNNIMIYGHTKFKTPTGWRTFSRLGISDSFYIDNFNSKKDPSIINDIIVEQIEKAKEAIEKNKNNIIVPGLPEKRSIDKNKIEEISELLKSGKTYTFGPGGMGIAYTISIKPLHKPIGVFNPSPLGPKELADFFGVPKIYITKQDYD